MRKYTRITEQERCLIEIGIRQGKSIRAIARRLDRPAKTISAEIKRNGGYLGYYAVKAHHERRQSNKKGYSKIDSNLLLINYIKEKLKEKWSPEVIAGRWNKKKKGQKISHESIYVWIYKQPNDLYSYLARSKKKRGLRPQRSKSNIPDRVSIHQRPEAINGRTEAGHYEGDLVFQQGNGSQNILTVVERKSRMVIFKKNDSKHSDVVVGALRDVQLKSKYPMKSLTLDNGTEFTRHANLKMTTYFCDPGSPWQKGSVENMNGILRRYIDYRIDANIIDQEMLDSVANMINNKPRKILGFLTPNEVISQLYNEKSGCVTF
jgi:IS30 family transposase